MMLDLPRLHTFNLLTVFKNEALEMIASLLRTTRTWMMMMMKKVDGKYVINSSVYVFS